MLGLPPGGPCEALGRDTLSVTANVVDAARQRKCREQSAARIADVERGAEVAHRLLEPRTGAVEEPESQDHTAPAGAGKAIGKTQSTPASR